MSSLPRPALPWLLLLALTACDRAELPLLLSAETLNDGTDFIIRAKTAEGATVRVNDKEAVANARGMADLKFPIGSFKLGKQKLTIQAVKGEQKASVETEVEREPIPASLKVTSDPLPAPYAAVTCSGQFCGAGMLQVGSSGKLALRLATARGTSVDIDGQKLVTTGNDEVFALDFNPRLPDAEIPFQAKMSDKLALPVRLRSPDDLPLEGTLDLEANVLEKLVSLRLLSVASGPVRFGDEPEAAGSAKSLVLTSPSHLDNILGNAKRVRDIDLVALLEPTASRPTSGECGPYTGKRGSPLATRAAVDYEVTVYERRTGKKLQTRTFPAGVDPCPESVYGKESSLVVTSYPKLPPILAWLKGQIRG